MSKRVRVKPYERKKNGKREHVSGHTRRIKKGSSRKSKPTGKNDVDVPHRYPEEYKGWELMSNENTDFDDDEVAYSLDSSQDEHGYSRTLSMYKKGGSWRLSATRNKPPFIAGESFAGLSHKVLYTKQEAKEKMFEIMNRFAGEGEKKDTKKGLTAKEYQQMLKEDIKKFNK